MRKKMWKNILFVELTMLIDCIAFHSIALPHFFTSLKPIYSIRFWVSAKTTRIATAMFNGISCPCDDWIWIEWGKKFQWNNASTLVNANFPYWYISIRQPDIANVYCIDTDSHYMLAAVNQWNRRILYANGWEKMQFARVKQIFVDFHWI